MIMVLYPLYFYVYHGNNFVLYLACQTKHMLYFERAHIKTLSFTLSNVGAVVRDNCIALVGIACTKNGAGRDWAFTD